METNLVGYRFSPTDEELINYYLKNKILGKSWLVDEAISEINICNYDPVHLPSLSKLKSADPVWYFFSPMEYTSRKKMVRSRRTASGLWKPTGLDRKIKDKGRNGGGEIGIKKTLVYIESGVPKGVKTHWVMHDYHIACLPQHQRNYVICKVKYNGEDGDIPSGGNLTFTRLPLPHSSEPSPSLFSDSKFINDFLCGEDKESSHHHISRKSFDGELTMRMEEYLAKKDVLDVRQKCIITNQNLKEDLYTSNRAFEGVSNRLPHAVYICCEDQLQYSFTSHLSMDFRRRGISPFLNCNGTLEVIEEAGASVVVFSESCFSSTSFLDKLVRVILCRRKTGQLVVPVFYGISPSDMVVQEHESADRIKEWSSALQELRDIPSHQSREECDDCELVEEIVKDAYEKLFPTAQVGVNLRVLELEQLLCKQPWGIRRIGIWGMPGIGKTILATTFFDRISGGYEASCFIKQFDKAFHEKGLHRLLEEHFGRITRPSLPKKRILVVLDDVQNPLVAESFLGGFHGFGPGSLIIIISRDKKVFRLCQIKHVYEVQSLNKDEALQLFSQCAFGKDIREQKLLELSIKVIDYANGIPLALSFYGRELKGKKLSEMETTFLKHKLRTPYKLHDLFKCSYETLTDNEKNIFLDIACFFNGENVDYVKPLLEGCGFYPHVGIDVLVEKCLVTISENRVQMHRLIQDFGREIINGETVQIERRRRLWEPWTIKFLLEAVGDPKATYTRAQGTEDIEGIFLDTSNLLFDVKPTAFENMFSLRFLKIYCSSYEKHYGVRLPKGLDSLPYELRLLHWENYPLQSLPENFDPCYLVELDMPYSQLQKLWGGTKNLDMLKRVRLGHSQQLTEIDAICQAKNIELIDLEGCTKLQSFPATGQLQHLRFVNLSGCKEIKSFPEVSKNIQELHLQGTGISKLPISIGNATNLKKLCLTGCSSLVELPSSIGTATKLEELNLEYCSSLVELPSSIGNATNLKKLYLTGCSSLGELPFSIRNSTSLVSIDLNEDTHLPVVTFSDNSGSRCIEVRRAKRGNFFILKGEQKDEHSVSLILCIIDVKGHARNFHFSFYKEGDTAFKVSSEIVGQLGLTDENIPFIAGLIDILLVNMIPTWKTDVRVDHLIRSQLNQNEAKTQRREETAFHDAQLTVSHSLTSDYAQSVVEDMPYVKYGSSNDEAELEVDEIEAELEVEEIEAIYQERIKEMTRRRDEAIERKKKRQKIVFDEDSC